MKRFLERLVRKTKQERESQQSHLDDPPQPSKGEKCAENTTCFELLTPGESAKGALFSSRLDDMLGGGRGREDIRKRLLHLITRKATEQREPLLLLGKSTPSEVHTAYEWYMHFYKSQFLLCGFFLVKRERTQRGTKVS